MNRERRGVRGRGTRAARGGAVNVARVESFMLRSVLQWRVP
jgi:hypothetical protein